MFFTTARTMPARRPIPLLLLLLLSSVLLSSLLAQVQLPPSALAASTDAPCPEVRSIRSGGGGTGTAGKRLFLPRTLYQRIPVTGVANKTEYHNPQFGIPGDTNNSPIQWTALGLRCLRTETRRAAAVYAVFDGETVLQAGLLYETADVGFHEVRVSVSVSVPIAASDSDSDSVSAAAVSVSQLPLQPPPPPTPGFLWTNTVNEDADRWMFVVHPQEDLERGRAEWGLRSFTPLSSSVTDPSQVTAESGVRLRLVLPAVWPGSLHIAVILVCEDAYGRIVRCVNALYCLRAYDCSTRSLWFVSPLSLSSRSRSIDPSRCHAVTLSRCHAVAL